MQTIDSLRNDIIPALEAGIYGIQISAEDATDWEHSLGTLSIHEDYEHKLEKIANFEEIINYFDKKIISDTIRC